MSWSPCAPESLFSVLSLPALSGWTPAHPPVAWVPSARMEHRFTGPSYTLGIEEELMIVDAETLDLVNSIETLLEEVPETTGDIKPELMESVLAIATTPVRNTREAGLQLQELRRITQVTAQQRVLTIGAAGPHPLAMREDQRII